MNDREVLAGDWIADFEMNQHENTDGKWRIEMTSVNCSPSIPHIKVHGWSKSETNGGFSTYRKNLWTISTNYTQNASTGINGKFTLRYIDLKGTENVVEGGLEKLFRILSSSLHSYEIVVVEKNLHPVWQSLKISCETFEHI